MYFIKDSGLQYNTFTRKGLVHRGAWAFNNIFIKIYYYIS